MIRWLTVEVHRSPVSLQYSIRCVISSGPWIQATRSPGARILENVDM